MRNTLLVHSLAAASLLTLVQGSATAAPLTAIETAARANAGNVQASQAERAAASARRSAAESENGVKVFGGAGLMDAREPVTDTLVRDYRRATATVGVRWSLLADRLAQKRHVKEAEWDVARAQMREDMAGNDAVRQVRIAAVRAAYAGERMELAKAFLSERNRIQSQLQARRQSGAMLGAEVLELDVLNDAVKAQLNRQAQVRTDAEQTIRRITGLQGDLALSNPAWPQMCFSATRLMQEDGRGQEAEQELSVAAASSQLRLLEGGILQSVNAGVSVSHSRLKDSPGHTGQNSGVYVDFTVPLQWKEVRDGRVAEWTAKRQQAEVQLQQARALRQFDIDKGLRERDLLAAELADAQTRLKASQESLRVANLRRPALQGDGIAEQFQARHAVYLAVVRVVDAAEKRSLAEADLLALGPECPTEERAQTASAVNTQLLAQLGSSKAAAAQLAPAAEPTPTAAAVPPPAPRQTQAQTQAQVQAPEPKPAAVAVAAANPDSTNQGKPPREPKSALSNMRNKLGWFVWDAAGLLKQPASIDRLPAHTGRLLLSFTAQQLRDMRPADWKGLRALADQRGMRLELLLGDPDWVTPKGRPALMRLLSGLQSLPVDGLNLDLERSQLPARSMNQAQWKKETVATIREVRKATQWELALTTHPRDLDDAQFLAALRNAGLREIVPMIYTQNANRAREVTQRLLAQSSGLHVGLAQSIERQLSKEESSFHQGRSKSIERWIALLSDLSRNPLFTGVIVQSMADYQQAKP